MIYLLALLLLMSHMGTGGWTARTVPASGSEERMCANRSDLSWAVSTLDDQLLIKKATAETDWTTLPSFLKPKREDQLQQMIDQFTAIEVKDGFLIGNDIGEFGGWVAWRSKNGKQSYKLLDGNPIGFAKVDGAIAVIEGLGHLGLRRGNVHYLAMSPSGRWVVRSTVDLGDVPYAFVAESTSGIIVVTSKGLVRVSESGVGRVADADYEHLYPNSIALAQGTYYVGMRYAISKLTPSSAGYSEEWLVPRNCATHTGRECRCVESDSE